MQQSMPPRPSAPGEPPRRPARRGLTRAEIRRRRRRRAARRLTVFALLLAVLAGGTVFAVSRLGAGLAQQDADSAALPQTVAESPAAPQAENLAASAPQAEGGMTAAEAAAILADPRMVLVNHDTPMPEGYTFDTKECGSATAINKTLQTEAADAFLAMQAAAAADGVTVWMQSGYRSVDYQSTLYDNKTKQYLAQGYDEPTARELAAGVVNPPGYSEHNCGLAADLNCPAFTALEPGFEETDAFAWLCEHAEQYGFILRYPKGEAAEAVTGITYEPWHWRYVGPENAAAVNASGLVFEEYIAQLQAVAATG